MLLSIRVIGRSRIKAKISLTSLTDKMKVKNIEIPLEEIKAFCTDWQVTEFALFSSVLREDFRPDSDIDVMVQFDSNAHPTFWSLEQMEAELKTILNVRVFDFAPLAPQLWGEKINL